jgi:hypothetical protein
MSPDPSLPHGRRFAVRMFGQVALNPVTLEAAVAGYITPLRMQMLTAVPAANEERMAPSEVFVRLKISRPICGLAIRGFASRRDSEPCRQGHGQGARPHQRKTTSCKVH